MANYTDLKTAIADYIKNRTGLETIDGVGLQQVLLSMVTSLGNGYLFKGVAVTTTNPGTPDQNVFYVAGPGTYPNFDGIVVNENEIAILMWNGAWSKVETGAASAAKLQALADDIYNNVVAYGYQVLTPDEVLEGEYFDTSGTIGTSANFNIWKYGNIVPGDTYAFSGYRAKTSTTRFLAWYASDGETCVKVEPYGGSSQSTTRYTHQIVTAPEGAAFAFLNVRTSYASSHGFYEADNVPMQDIYDQLQQVVSDLLSLVVDNLTTDDATKALSAKQGKVLADGLNELKESVSKNSTAYDTEPVTPTIVDDQAWTATGLVESTTYDLYKYPVTAGKTYLLSWGRSATVTRPVIAWFGANDTFISQESYAGGSSAITHVDDQIVAPEGALYAYVNVQAARASYYSLKEVQNVVRLQTIKEKVDGLSDALKPEDIADNLNTDDASKILSAKQGKILGDIVSANEYEALEHEELRMKYFDSNGEIGDSASTYSLWIIALGEGRNYAITSSRSSTANQYLLAWYDRNGNYISKEDYRAATLDRQPVTAPAGAAFAYINVQNSRSTGYEFYAVQRITMQDLYEMVSEQDVLPDLTLPAYYDEYLASRIEDITRRIFNVNKGDSFGFITDTHPSNYYNVYSGAIFRKLLGTTPLRKVVFGGDVGPNNATKYGGGTTALDALVKSFVQQNQRLLAPVREIGEMYSVRGNHDYSSRMYPDSNEDNTGWQASNGATRGLIVNGTPGIVSDPTNPDACYYYFDNVAEKIRYIVADTSDSVGAHYTTQSNVLIWVSDAQAKWFAETALGTLPDGYDVIVFAHCPLAKVACYGTYWNKSSVIRLKRTMFAANAKESITLSKTDSGASGTLGTFDFSNFGGRILAVISGHVHCDEQTYENGILFYTSAADYVTQDQLNAGVENAMGATIQRKARNTIYEDLLNAVVVDTDTMAINVFRVGAGYDRKFNLAKNTVAVGGNLTLTSSLGGTLTWFSYDALNRDTETRPMQYIHTVASVSNGVVTGLLAGESVVVAYSEQDKTFEFFYIVVE